MLAPHRRPCDTPEAYKPSEEFAGATRWVLPATILGSSVMYIDESVVNVALPAIQRSLETSLATMQWVFNGYMLTLASLILLGGAASDRFGRRRIFLFGLAGFAAASVACGLAPSAVWLIFARLAQGAAAALLMPASLAIIGAAFKGEARGRAIGTWAAAGALTIAISRPFGGWLVDAIGWRSIFFINLPLAAAALLLALKLPADRGTRSSTPLDLRGTVLAVLALALLSYGLIALGEGDHIAGSIAIAAAIPVTWLFVRTEARADSPMVPLALFRNIDFAGVNALTVLYYAALSGAFFLLPFVLIEVHGYSATAAGAAFLPLSVIMAVGSRWTGALVERTGARLPLVLGPLITAAGYALLGFSGSASSYWTGFLPGLVIVALGLTLTVAPLTATVFDSSPKGESGTAAGINSAVDVAGGLVAVAALGLAFGGTGAGGMQGNALVEAYQVVMFVAAVLAALSALTVALTIGARGKRGDAVASVKS